MRHYLITITILIVFFGTNVNFLFAAVTSKNINNNSFTVIKENNYKISNVETKIFVEKTKIIFNKIKPDNPILVGDDQLVAAILAFFLGFLGIHRFYLGYTGIGVIQLILSLTVIGLFITLPWALVDFIFIVLNKLLPKNGYYNKTIYF